MVCERQMGSEDEQGTSGRCSLLLALHRGSRANSQCILLQDCDQKDEQSQLPARGPAGSIETRERGLVPGRQVGRNVKRRPQIKRAGLDGRDDGKVFRLDLVRVRFPGERNRAPFRRVRRTALPGVGRVDSCEGSTETSQISELFCPVPVGRGRGKNRGSFGTNRSVWRRR